jgi:hypothetical protein
MAETIVEKIEELVDKRNQTSDPNKVWEIDCEIENCMNELEGV